MSRILRFAAPLPVSGSISTTFSSVCQGCFPGHRRGRESPPRIGPPGDSRKPAPMPLPGAPISGGSKDIRPDIWVPLSVCFHKFPRIPPGFAG
jgi:hypothetical protein